MSKIPIIDLHGQTAGEYEVADELLVLKRGSQAVHDVVVAYQAGRRAGTACTLNKGRVAGSNRKPWQQKGLGRARAGYRQSPIWRGGGVVFGPRPRSYAKKVSKKLAALAFARALSEKINDGSLKILSELALAEGKTRQLMAILKELNVKGRALFVTDKPDVNLQRAARNAPAADVDLAGQISVYQIMFYPNLLVTRAAMPGLVARLKKAAGE